ncbi:hypothetical protein FisN_3Lh134 [Fistulifera solaris]|uniref:Uncharacterized protein n=1 Tax=Fistulifera solaris TaxID=1519565 RepID=A0A1Z5JI03_FISSO|nr:hypothetical protein FisN_3Lh134 [Fistulifera solaris]|eukprot:GAX13566.1 hypothetical protein FisN_3Lh134 [Fistulifera solaris]
MEQVKAQSAHPSMLYDLIAAPVTADDLDEPFKGNEENVAFLKKFEEAWKEYVFQQSIEKLPKGKRECCIDNLQAEAKEIVAYKEKLEGELREQREFIRTSLVKSEESFQKNIRTEKRVQRATHVELSQQIEYADKVQTLQKETLPWFHFLEQLNDTVDQYEDLPSHEDVDNAIRPSKRGFFLSHRKGNDEPIHVEELRAYRMDHAIMTAHVQMLTKEIERCEKLACLREYASAFLNDKEVCNILEEYEQDGATLVTENTEETMEGSNTSEKPVSVTKTKVTESSEKTIVDDNSCSTSEKMSSANETNVVYEISEKTDTDNHNSDASEQPVVDTKEKEETDKPKKKRGKGKRTKADEEILKALEQTIRNMGSMTDLEETVKENKKEKTVDVSWSEIRQLLAH